MHFHVFASGVVVFAGLYFQLAVLEWMALTLTISLVFSMEILNSAVEDIANTVKDKLNLDYEATSRMRDIAAGGVLVSAIGAVVMGLLIFGPKVIDLVRF